MIFLVKLGAANLLLVLLMSVPADAQGFLAPFVGYNFGGQASTCAGLPACSPKHTGYGVAVGGMGRNLGFEEELGYTQNFLGTAAGATSSVFSLMSDLLFPGGSGKVRSYLVTGGGFMRSHASLDQTNAEGSAFAYDVGGGVNALMSRHFGFRADLRHFHTFQDVPTSPTTSNKLGFWRASLGLLLTF